MVPISAKSITHRTATAKGSVYFSNPDPLRLIRENSNKKGDVLSISRVAGIMAVKKTPELVPLCHNINISSVVVDLAVIPAPSRDPNPGHDSKVTGEVGKEVEREGETRRSEPGEGGGIDVMVTVECDGKTGVEMEALTGVMGACLTVVDMCKAVDKRIWVGDVRVVEKRGGRSGVFVE